MHVFALKRLSASITPPPPDHYVIIMNFETTKYDVGANTCKNSQYAYLEQIQIFTKWQISDTGITISKTALCQIWSKLIKNLKSLQFIWTYLLPLEESLHLCKFPSFKDASSLFEISPTGVGEDISVFIPLQERCCSSSEQK